MAFVSTNSQIKKNILNYISRLVSKTLYRSIEILFKPCCDITITNVEVVCNGTNYDITITLDKSINMLGNGLLLIQVDGVLIEVDGNGGAPIPYNDSNKIVLLNVDINNIPGDYDILIFFLLPSSPAISFETLTPGVFTFAITASTVEFPSCP